MSYYWPIFLVVFSNIFYHICAKGTPENLNPFFSVVITYLVGTFFALALYFFTAPNPQLGQEITKINWASIVLGFAIVGLEAGNIYMYKAGWPISTGYMVQSALLAIALLAVGYLIYHENITVTKLLGIIICLIGLYFLNK